MSTGSNATAVANQPSGADIDLQKELSLGMGAAQSGDKASAYRIFQTLATRYTDAPDIWVWLGGTSPNLDEAEAAFQRAVMLDPNNEEANLGLRWVTLRKHALAAAGAGPASAPSTSTTSSLDTGVFTMGRSPSERLTDALNSPTSGLGQVASAATGPLGTGHLNSSLKTAIISNSPTGPLTSSDVDKSVKMKVDKKSGLRRIPIGAIILILIAIALYAFAAWMLLR
jgi:hypothetical protein